MTLSESAVYDIAARHAVRRIEAEERRLPAFDVRAVLRALTAAGS